MNVWDGIKMEAYQEGKEANGELEARSIIDFLIRHMPDAPRGKRSPACPPNP